MPVLKLKPYTFQLEVQAQVTIDEATGDPIVAEDGYVSGGFACDIVPSGSASKVVVIDGQSITYAYTVYAGPKAPLAHVGQGITIFDQSGGVVFKGNVKGCHKYQKQTKIWV